MRIATVSTRQSESGSRFVQGPHGFNTHMIFCNAPLTEQIGRPIVAFGGVKSHAVIITNVSLTHIIASLTHRVASLTHRVASLIIG